MSGDESAGFKAYRHFFSSRESAEAQRSIARRWEQRVEVVGRGEVDRIIETRVGPYASLEVSGASIYLTEQLDLKPSLADLNGTYRLSSSAQFSDTEQADLSDEVNEPLGDSHDRADLTYAL
ncbi:hypothetical protein [Sinomonas terrae]|uniref:Uncharacterized protein n=1 Tax=Sinomonas terrae TaxID=2908838 RepID=A0ABS9U1Z4_9MICC|nr:hypothetical protein [Sinomonas terrae]MCH6470701.1 hypothetical protein [Sinomonas terrae]